MVRNPGKAAVNVVELILPSRRDQPAEIHPRDRWIFHHLPSGALLSQAPRGRSRIRCVCSLCRPLWRPARRGDKWPLHPPVGLHHHNASIPPASPWSTNVAWSRPPGVVLSTGRAHCEVRSRGLFQCNACRRLPVMLTSALSRAPVIGHRATRAISRLPKISTTAPARFSWWIFNCPRAHRTGWRHEWRGSIVPVCRSFLSPVIRSWPS
jgi:hypothetical protein